MEPSSTGQLLPVRPVTNPELIEWLGTPIDWEAFEEVTLVLLPDRGEVIEMPSYIHGPGVRKRPTPQPFKPIKCPAKHAR